MTGQQINESQIIAELKTGNETYLKYLYRYLPDVRRFILQNSGDEDDAKDMLQEAIIAFYNNLLAGKYTQTNLKGYILTVVKNKWFDILDKLKRQRDKVVELKHGEEEAQEDKHFEINKPTLSLGEYLQDALDKLGHPCNALLKATVYVKTRMEQVAKDFGYADAHSARMQKLRCLKRLRGFTSYEDIMNLT